MKNKILLSIICPAYNEEEKISRMIDSIINQKYKNYELILLNDGSTDNTLKIMKQYSKKYNNIITINKTNTGAGYSRNEGIKLAKGKYIMFADADDYYENNLFDVIVPEMIKSDFDLLYFNFTNNRNKKSIRNIDKSNQKFVDKNGTIKYLKGTFCHKIGNGPCNKIYVRSILNKYNILFPNKKKGEDLIFNIKYVSKIEKYLYVNQELYNYDINFNYNMITNNTYRDYEIDETVEYYDILKSICDEGNIKKSEQYLGLFFLRRFTGIVLNECNNSSYSEAKKNIRKFLEIKKIADTMDKVKISDFDFKLFISYLIYKFKLYKLLLIILRKRK